MMKRINFLWSFLLVILSFMSCISFDDMEYTPSLVLEGWIGNGDYPVVQLGQSISIEEQKVDLSDYVVRWGVVTISDGTHTEVLRSHYDDHYFPPYIYTSYNMVGEPGKTYKISVKYKDYESFSTTTIPDQSVKIDSSRIIHVKDSLYYIRIFFTDDSNEEDYYLVSSQVIDKDLGFQVAMMGVLSDSTLQKDKAVQMDVYRGVTLFSSMSQANDIYFVKGDRVKIRLMKIDRASYLFWNSFVQYKGLASNMLFPYTSELKSNILNGKGCWCGYQSDERYIQIEDR